MPRTDLPIEDVVGPSPLGGNTLAFTAADTSNGNAFEWTGRELLLIRNVGASTHTVTFQTKAVGGRQDPIHNSAQNIAAGDYVLWGDFDAPGFEQTDGKLYVSGNHAEVEFCVIRLRK